MNKQAAINFLGGSARKAAGVLGISVQAVYDWPDPLSPRIVDRILGACLRQGIKVPAELLAKPVPQGAANE